MAESLPGPSVEKKRKTSGCTTLKFSWTLPENITSSAKRTHPPSKKKVVRHF